MLAAHRAPTSARSTVFFGNLLARNPKVPQAMEAVAATDADVLVLTEFTPAMHAELVARCGDRYPHRIEDVRPDPAGIAIWSRLPLRGDDGAVERPAEHRRPHRRARHEHPPDRHPHRAAHHAGPGWSRELRDIGDLADGADVVLGDFNAARWHPSFRRLLGRGWTTAHEWLGHWSSNSWANEGRAFPLFVRIDHALLRDRVQPVRVAEVPLPGSDHRGFVLTVTRRSLSAVDQRDERPAAVRDGVLLGLAHLAERAAVAVVGDEQRVVAEAAFAALLGGDAARAHALDHQLASRRASTTIATVRNRHAGRRRRRARRASSPGSRRRWRSGRRSTRCPHPARRRARRRTGRCRRDRRQAGGGADGRRLQPGVAHQRAGVLHHVGHVGRARQQVAPARRGCDAISATLCGLADAARRSVGTAHRPSVRGAGGVGDQLAPAGR